MSIKRFFAATARDVLRMVRESLGPDGVILSNRAVEGGIEILALKADDLSSLIPSLSEDEDRNVSGPTPENPALAPAPAVYKEETRYQGQAGLRAASGRHEENVENSVERQTKTREVIKAAYMEEAREETGKEEMQNIDIKLDELPGLQFPTPKGEQVQRAVPWQIPNLTTEPRQTPRQILHGLSASHVSPHFAPGSSMPDKKPLPITDTGAMMSKGVGAQTGKDQENQPANQNPANALNAGKKRRTPSHSAKAAKPTFMDAFSSDKNQSGATSSRQVADEVAASVLTEIRAMRGTLEQQLAALAWNEQQRRNPSHGRILGQLLATGLSSLTARELLERLPAGQDAESAMNWIKTVLTGNLRTIANENEILDKGGVYALVGPTGVGKTTTTAKLAARCVVRHGADKLALLTTDGYRIGGHEQLRIYGKILGVTVYAVKDAQDLTLALAELRGKHMVLIDTVGMGQRDRMVAEQVAMLAGCGTEVKRLLLLNAASSGDTLHEVVQAYEGSGLAGAIITKLDEAATTGCVLDIVIRHQLRLYYVATGQRVPEDLHLGEAGFLVNNAFNDLPAASPFAVPEEVFPALMAGFKSGVANSLRTSGGHLA